MNFGWWPSFRATRKNIDPWPRIQVTYENYWLVAMLHLPNSKFKDVWENCLDIPWISGGVWKNRKWKEKRKIEGHNIGQYDPSQPTADIMIHHYRYPSWSGILSIDGMTHKVWQGRLCSIIMKIGREAEFRQSTVRPILADSGHYNTSLLMSVMRR